MKRNLQKAAAIILFLTAIMPLHSIAQENDYNRWNLKGRVKSIRENSYALISEKDNSAIDSLEYYYLNEFDSFGNKTVDTKYSSDGVKVKDYQYKYDDQHRRIEQDQFTNGDKLLRIITYVYDESGKVTEDNSVNSAGEPETLIRFTYGPDGKITEDNSFNGDGKLKKRFTYAYDSEGRKVEVRKYNASGIFEQKITFTYDHQGNTIEESKFGSDDKPLNTLKFSYVYDNHNNWTVKTTTTKDKTVNRLERIITYFE
jgi:hypothetical protein